MQAFGVEQNVVKTTICYQFPKYLLNIYISVCIVTLYNINLMSNIYIIQFSSWNSSFLNFYLVVDSIRVLSLSAKLSLFVYYTWCLFSLIVLHFMHISDTFLYELISPGQHIKHVSHWAILSSDSKYWWLMGISELCCSFRCNVVHNRHG